jgi:plasmid rolling circle replication initiator protein Rep
MLNLYKRQPEGTGKNVNKKQLQDFVREMLFEKSLGELKEMEQADSSEWPIASAAIIQTVILAVKDGDFTRLNPVLDFAFEKDTLKTKTRAKK